MSVRGVEGEKNASRRVSWAETAGRVILDANDDLAMKTNGRAQENDLVCFRSGVSEKVNILRPVPRFVQHAVAEHTMSSIVVKSATIVEGSVVEQRVSH